MVERYQSNREDDFEQAESTQSKGYTGREILGGTLIGAGIVALGLGGLTYSGMIDTGNADLFGMILGGGGLAGIIAGLTRFMR